MTAPQQPVARLSERVTKLERQRVTYREATVLAVDTLNSTFDAEVAGAGRLDGIPTPPQFMPAVGDVVQLQLSGATPIYQPQRIGEGTIGTTELAGYVTENITLAMETADGKNTFWFSPDAPTTEIGTAVGDPWMQRDDVTRIIEGSWEWDGDSWEPFTFGDEVLSSLTVGKLVGGTGTFDLIVGGRVATAMTGQRTELNPLGLQGFNSSNTLTLHLDGIANLITGTMQTALTGRRIVMGSAGAVGEFNLFSPDGKQGQIRSYTESSGVEAIQFGMLIPSTNFLWNRINYNSDEWANYRARIHDFYFASNNGAFVLRSTSDKGATATTRLDINGTDNNHYSAANGSHFFNDTGGASLYQIDAANGRHRFKTKPDLGWIEISNGSGGAGGPSPRFKFLSAPYNGGTYGCTFKFYIDGDGARLELLNVLDNGYERLRALSFDVMSEASAKHDIADVDPATAEAELLAMRFRSYRTKRGGPIAEKGKKAPADAFDDRMGIVAGEAPASVLVGGAQSGRAVDLYSYATVIGATVQGVVPVVRDLERAVADLRAEVAELRKGTR